MELIERINLIQDGEPLDGVGDNPDVLNRTVKQLVDILESGDQDSILVQKTNIKVDSTDFESNVATGDLVYYNAAINKFSKASIQFAELIIGVADLSKNIIIMTGKVTISGAAFVVGKMVYLSNSNAGKIVADGSIEQSKYPVGIALSSTEVLLKGSVAEQTDEDAFGDVFLDEVQTLTNKTITSSTNTVAANYSHLRVVNRTGSTLTKGTVVSLNGWDDTFEAPDVVRGTYLDTDKTAVGLIITNANTNGYALVMTDGLLSGIDTSAYLENEILYVGETAGTFTNVKPSVNAQVIGRVVRSDSTMGSIYITLGLVASDIDFESYTTAAPNLSGPTSGNENSTIVITRTNFDTEATYFTTVSGGTTIDNGDGTVSWTLPSVVNNTVHYYSEYATKKGELKSDFVSKAVNVLSVPVPTPILSGPTSANENTTIEILIDNYDAATAYTVNVTLGTFTRTAGSISWTLPEVAVDTNGIISVFGEKDGGTSATADKVVQILDVPIEADAAASISNFGDNEFNDGWSV